MEELTTISNKLDYLIDRSQKPVIIEKPVSKKGIAEHLEISTKTVDKLISEGMPHVRAGREYRFFKSEVNEWLKERRMPKIRRRNINY